MMKFVVNSYLPPLAVLLHTCYRDKLNLFSSFRQFDFKLPLEETRRRPSYDLRDGAFGPRLAREFGPSRVCAWAAASRDGRAGLPLLRPSHVANTPGTEAACGRRA